ncbi:MAG: glycosyltransferase family 39 protein [Anaerolineae bacterium]
MRATTPALRADTASTLAVGIVLVGIALRLWLYLRGASLWLDEAMLANNIVNRAYAGLLQRLDHDQGAPVGFLLLQKLILQTLGNADYKLRLWPLVAGVAALCLMYPVARRALGASGALAATALFALSPALITHSATVKQYSTDAVVALLLLLAGLTALDRYPARQPLAVLAVGGGLAVWMSHPSIFVLMGIGVALALFALSRKDWRWLAYLLATVAVWGLAFLAIYVVSLRTLAANTFLTSFWQDNFLPMPFWQHLDWVGPAFLGLVANPGGLPATFGLLLAAVGAGWLLWRRWPVGLMLTLPWLATLAASAAQKYPFGDRLALFLLPSLYLLVGGGIELVGWLAGRARPSWAMPAAAAIAVVLAGFLLIGDWNAETHPSGVENVKPLLAYVAEHKQPGDVLFVYYGGEPAARYYAPFYDLAGVRLDLGDQHRFEPAAYLKEVDRFVGEPRVWVLFSHTCDWCQVDEQPYILQHLDTVGRRLDARQVEGAALYLYDLRSSP